MDRQEVMDAVNRYYNELGDIMQVEGAGLAARALAKGHPLTNLAGATASGMESYRQELNRLAQLKDMSDLERYGRAGLVGLTDAIYGYVPMGNLFKQGVQNGAKYIYSGLANLGANLINNRAAESANDAIWGDY